MLKLAAVALVGSGLLSVAAVAAFPWSIAAARWLIPGAVAVGSLGALSIGLAGRVDGILAWSFLFACGACGCSANAARNLRTRPGRWVHRFVIYAGYGATSAGMGAAGLWLGSRAVSGTVAASVLIGAYVVGSACIFAAKTLTLRRTARTMPEYHASLAADPGASYS